MMKAVFVAAAAAMLSIAVSAQAAPLRVCTTDWPPFTMTDTVSKAVTGTHTELTAAAFKKAGYDVQIDSLAWERCLKDVETGDYDAAYSASFKDERAAYSIYPKRPLQTLSYVMVVRKGTKHGWDAAKDGAKLPQPIAAPRGYSITGDLKKMPGVTVEESAITDSQNIQKLLAGRLETMAVEETVLKALIKRFDAADKIDVLQPPVVSGKNYFIIVSKKHGGSEAAASKLAGQLDAAIEQLDKEGFLANVSAKY
ncbi:MAG: transporter substrate-binding domain-containing protein [Rhodospirillaceae bacterium]|nr:transporter substrate-binding domain-containing protein [Rhodospirillales bacterium]